MAYALEDYIERFESSEETTDTSRRESEKHRRYYDSKQLTTEEVATLKKRGQPPVVINKIKGKVKFLKGMERNSLSDPKASPRNAGADEQSADVAQQGLRYLVQRGKFKDARRGAWENLVIEGTGGVKLVPRQGKEHVELGIQRVPWDRMFWDPHSSEHDFSDARFLGEVVWMDRSEALRIYGVSAKDVIESTLSHTSTADTYDDKPRWKLWGDQKRKRVRVVQMWCLHDEGWVFVELTKAGFLKEPAPSWLKDDEGQPIHPYVWRSAYVEGETNARYGPIRELIDPQDEYNKRRSKALHLLNTRGVIYRRNAVKDAEALRRELAKPDYAIEVDGDPSKPVNDSFVVTENVELGAAQAKLMEQVSGELDAMGPNAAMAGKDPRDQSGRAILAQQQGGMIEAGELTDLLDSLDEEVYRKGWLFIRQYWTEPMWIQVTDNEEAPQWLGLNQPVLNTWGMQVGTQNHVAEMDMDIIIEPAPKVVLPEGEEFAAFAQLSPTLMEMATNGQFDMARLTIEMIPSLRPMRKRRLLALIDKEEQAAAQRAQAQMQMQAQQVQMEAAAKAQGAAQAAQIKAQADLQMKRESLPFELEAERMKAQAAAVQTEPRTPLDDAEQVANIEHIRAQTYKTVKDANKPPPQARPQGQARANA